MVSRFFLLDDSLYSSFLVSLGSIGLLVSNMTAKIVNEEGEGKQFA